MNPDSRGFTAPDGQGSAASRVCTGCLLPGCSSVALGRSLACRSACKHQPCRCQAMLMMTETTTMTLPMAMIPVLMLTLITRLMLSAAAAA